jgi:hypothetical protein
MNTLVIDCLRLRRAVGALGALLPFALLAIAGPQESLSAYYHTAARDVFVGALCTIAALLAAYRGYDRGDRICSRAAAAALLVVAFSPTGDDLLGWAHLAGAVVFFLAVAALCWRFGFGGYRVRTFRALAGFIVGAVAASAVCSALGMSIMAAESVAVVAFGAGWLIKGRALGVA